ncbi:MAG: hypothetical protein Kow00121_02900 [Elainellaceae cyanobacterium]
MLAMVFSTSGLLALAAEAPDPTLKKSTQAVGERLEPKQFKVTVVASEQLLGAIEDSLADASHDRDTAIPVNPENTIQSVPIGTSTRASDLLHGTSGAIARQEQTWETTQVPEPSTEESPGTQSDEPSEVGAEAATPQANLAQQSQNPIANLISVPFQNNTNFGVGQFDRTSNVLNIQPVVPTPLSEDLVLINRFIVPLVYQPELAQVPLPDGSTESIGDVFGLGDIVYQGFFSPQTSGNFTWGVGPILSFPTATDDVLGTAQWSAGPAAVGLVTSGRIVTGALVNQLWSYAGDGDRPDVSSLTIQPFFNYNFNQGWYVTTSPVITANWEAESDDQWTVPIGGGFGRVFNVDRQPVNASLSVYWNATKPEGAADWTLRTQITLLFP